jgi:hypothetical protein
LDCKALVGNSLAGRGLLGSLTPMNHRRRTRSPFNSPTPSGSPLDAASVETIARRVVELLRTESQSSHERRLVDAATLAAELGVERSWVYAHRAELGAIQLGSGSKPRLRFDVDVARELLAHSAAKQPQTQQPPTVAGSQQHRHRQRSGSGAELLPIRGVAENPDASRERPR